MSDHWTPKSGFLRVPLPRYRAHLAFEAHCLEIDRNHQPTVNSRACKIDRRAISPSGIRDLRNKRFNEIPFRLATISTRRASLVRKAAEKAREGDGCSFGKAGEYSIGIIYLSLPTYPPTYLSIYLPACASYRPQHSANRRLRAARNAIESNRIGPFLPSFLPSSLDQVSRCSSLFWVSELAAASAQGRANGRRESIATTRLASTRSRAIFESKQAELDENSKRNERRGARARPGPRPIDRSIDRSDELDESTKRARAGQTYGAVFCFGKVSCVPDRTKEAFVPRRTAVLGNYQRSYSSTWFRESLVRDSRSRFPSR